MLLVLSCVFVACKNDEIADNTEHYDKITKTLKLNLSYEGKSFLNDGVGVFRVDAFTDGDTTRFYSETDGTVNIRYYCIDTPESTGGIEKWGKAASNFVKERLSEATVIVLESSTGKAAVKDSYGTRYLGYVWYKTATDDFKLLNLEIVENGFSVNKGDSTSKYKYNEYFVKAEKFARSIQLRLFSKKADPLYNTDPVPFSIKEFDSNPDLFYNAETDTGTKVVFEAYLISLQVSSSGTHTFVAAQYDAETGTQYTINVYAAYNSSPASNMKVGGLYKIVGALQKHTSGFQLSGINYNTIFDGADITFPKAGGANYYLTFDSSLQYRDQLSDNLFTNVRVTEIVGTVDGVLTFKGEATKRLSASNNATEKTTFTFKLKVPASYSNDITVGKSLKLGGLQLTAGEITVITYSL